MSALQDILATAPLFKNFIENDLLALASAMRERHLKPGAVLFRQGQQGDAMVLVVAGVLLILAEEDDGQTVELARIGVGDIVGEMSALDPAPRSATVKAEGAAIVYVLDRTMLGAVMNNAPSVYASLLKGIGRAVTGRLDRTNKQVRTEAFGHIDVFDGPVNAPTESTGQHVQKNMDPSALDALKGFTPKERGQLLTAAPIIAFQKGDVLCAEGQPGHTCFIIGDGEVEILRHSGDEEHRLATLGPGSVVGQLALLHDAPRSATVRATGPVWVVAIGRGSFGRMLGTHTALGLKLHEQVIVAGIRQLRLASRMLTEMRLAQEETDTLSDYPAAMSEWGLSLSDLDNVQVSVPDGQITAAELKARKGR